MAGIQTTETSGVTILQLTGSLTFVELQEIQREFEQITHQDALAVIVDLSNVDMLTTPAISMFLAAAKDLKASGGRIMVSGPQPRVGEILKRLRLDALLPVCETIDCGIEALKKH